MAAASLDETQAKRVLRQVEFYFSDSNLPRDKFLKKTVEESEDGLVSLALICSFARMRTFLGLGEVKADLVPEDTLLAVAETLKKSNFIKVSEDGKRVGRSSKLAQPEQVMEQVDSRTIAATPFPYDVKIEDIETLFGEHGKVNSVRLPRLLGGRRHFCGTALVEFSQEEDAKKVLGTSIAFAGTELEMKPKKDFDAEREKKRIALDEGCSNKDLTNRSYPKGLIVAFKLKNIQAEGATVGNGQEAADACKTAEVPGSDGEKKTSENVDSNEQTTDDQKGNDKKINEDQSEKTEEKTKEKTNAAALQEHGDNTGCAVAENAVTREDIKAVFEKYGTVKYIDFMMGEDSGYIRFEDPDAAIKARAAAVFTDEGGFTLKNYIATLEPLSGDAEKEYWSLLRSNQEKHRDNKGMSNRGRGKGGKGGKQFDGKRNREADKVDGRANKAQKA